MGSRLRLKCAEENSGRSGVGSMNDARPASASGPRAGSSRGAEGAAGRPDTSDGEEGVRTGIVHNAGVLGIGRARFLHTSVGVLGTGDVKRADGCQHLKIGEKMHKREDTRGIKCGQCLDPVTFSDLSFECCTTYQATGFGTTVTAPR